MKRYRLENGILTPPPKNSVCKDGKILSNFAGRIASDKEFAEKNGYYPLAPLGGTPKFDPKLRTVFVLEHGAWVRKCVPRKPL